MAKNKEQDNGIFSAEVLAKLKETKQSLVKEEQKRAEEIEAKKQFERKQREKNMSFGEMLDKYGNQGSKF